MLFILEPNEITRSLACKRVMVLDYPDGRFAIRHNGVDLPYRTFDKRPQVNQAAIVENKRLGPVLAYIAEQHKELDMSRSARHRGGVASAITCSRSDRPEQGRLGRRLRYLGAPRVARTGTTLQPRNQEWRLPFSPKIVTSVTGAKSDFSKRRRHSQPRDSI